MRPCTGHALTADFGRVQLCSVTKPPLSRHHLPAAVVTDFGQNKRWWALTLWHWMHGLLPSKQLCTFKETFAKRLNFWSCTVPYLFTYHFIWTFPDERISNNLSAIALVYTDYRPQARIANTYVILHCATRIKPKPTFSVTPLGESLISQLRRD